MVCVTLNLKTFEYVHLIPFTSDVCLSSSRVDPFSAPIFRMDTKPRTIHNVEHTSDISASLEKLQLTVYGMVKTQELMMNNIVNIERTQQKYPRVPYKGKIQKGNQVFTK
jgi:hypothetical protein